MDIKTQRYLCVIFVTLFLGLYTAAARPLQSTESTVYLAGVETLRSLLQKGPVPTPGNPCRSTPGRGTGVCKLAEKNFAGGRNPAAGVHPPAYPTADGTVTFGVASVVNQAVNVHEAAHPRS